MNTLSVCALAIGATLLILLIRGFRAEISLPISLCLTLCLLTVAYGLLRSLLNWLTSLWSQEYLPYLETLLKSTGISVVASLASEICKDAGEGSVAGAVELVAKCEILCLSLPILQELLTLALSPLTS